MNLSNYLSSDTLAVRSYVTGADHLQYTQLAGGTVQLNITHSNLRQFVQELRLDLHSSIGEIKRKLYTHNGSSIESMELQLKNKDGAILSRMLDDDRPLGYYGPTNGMTIHVVDTDPFSLSRNGGLDDVSRIEKYKMTDEEYEKREKSYRAWKKQNQAADPNWKPPHISGTPGGAAGGAGDGTGIDYTTPESISHVTMGSRCSVTPGDRRGEVAFIGEIQGLAAGYWVGIRLDEPMGKNDGTFSGKRYFECEAKFGSFVRPTHVTCGAQFKPIWEEEFDELDVGGGVAADTTNSGSSNSGGDIEVASPKAADDLPDAAATTTTASTTTTTTTAPTSTKYTMKPKPKPDEDSDGEL